MRNGHNDQCVCADCNTERQQAAVVPAGVAPETLTVEVRDPGVATVPPQQELGGLGIPPTMPAIVLPPVTAKRHLTMPQGLHAARVLGVVELQVEAVGAEIVALWLVDHDQRSWAIWFDRARREMAAAPLLA
jgi:hypothetical protein